MNWACICVANHSFSLSIVCAPHNLAAGSHTFLVGCVDCFRWLRFVQTTCVACLYSMCVYVWRVICVLVAICVLVVVADFEFTNWSSTWSMEARWAADAFAPFAALRPTGAD